MWEWTKREREGKGEGRERKGGGERGSEEGEREMKEGARGRGREEGEGGHIHPTPLNVLTPAHPRGALWTPLRNLSVTVLFTMTFAHRFLRKKLDGSSNFCDKKI